MKENQHPKISIVTPSLNQGNYIEKAISSVLDQNYPNIEHIIVDGGSTDRTVEILDKYKNNHAFVIKVVPGLDLYSSLNMCIQSASGLFVGWLNCDDYYAKDLFWSINKIIRDDDGVEAICGNGEVFSEDKSGARKILKEYSHYEGERLIATRQNVFAAHINCCFLRKNLFDSLGLFDTKYKIASDRDFLFRLLNHGPKSTHLNRVIYHYRSHEKSLTFSETTDYKKTGTLLAGDSIALEELFDIARRYGRDLNSAANIRRWSRGYVTGYTLRKFIEAVKTREVRRAVDLALLGLRYNRIWPARLAFRIINLLLGNTATKP